MLTHMTRMSCKGANAQPSPHAPAQEQHQVGSPLPEQLLESPEYLALVGVAAPLQQQRCPPHSC